MKLAIVGLFLVACGSSQIQADRCATPGASYIMHFAEKAGGTCGPVPDQLMNVSSDGTIDATPSPGSTYHCSSIDAHGCTLQKNNCAQTNTDGVTCTADSTVTFTADGSAASGLFSVSCNGAGACSSVYSASLFRQ
jgi:hypothetical protein